MTKDTQYLQSGVALQQVLIFNVRGCFTSNTSEGCIRESSHWRVEVREKCFSGLASHGEWRSRCPYAITSAAHVSVAKNTLLSDACSIKPLIPEQCLVRIESLLHDIIEWHTESFNTDKNVCVWERERLLFPSFTSGGHCLKVAADDVWVDPCFVHRVSSGGWKNPLQGTMWIFSS